VIEAYRIGCTLALGPSIDTELTTVIGLFERLDAVVKQVQRDLAALSGPIRAAAALDGTLTRSAAASERMSRATADMQRTMPDVAQQAAQTAAAMERAATASRGFTLVGGPVSQPNFELVGSPYEPPRQALVPFAAPGTPVPFYGSYGGYPGPHTAYAPGGPVVPYVGGGGSGAVPPPIDLSWPVNPRPSGHDFALAALGYGIAGRALTGFTGDVLQAGAEYGHQLTMLRAMGWTEDQVAAANRTAMQAQRDILGVQPAGALEAQRDIFTVTRNVQESMHLAPDLLRASVVLSEVGKGGQLQQLFQALQAGELRGVISAEQIPNFLREMETAAVVTGGRVGPAEILQFLRSSGVAGRILAQPDLFGQFIPEILSMGASRGGTGLQAFFQQFGIGRMSDAAVKNFLEQMGLAQEGGKFIKAGIGQWMALPGGLKGEQLVYTGNEAQFMREVLLTAIDEYNRTHFGYTDPLMEARTGAALSSRIPGGRFLGEYFTLLPLSARYSEAMREGSARDPYAIFSQNDPTLKVMGLQAAWSGFLTSLANGPVMDAATKVLQDVTGALNNLGKFADDHKTLAATIVGIAEALGVLATAAAGVSAALWLLGPMIRVGRWAYTALGSAAVGAAAVDAAPVATAAGAGALASRAGPAGLVGALLWDAPSAMGLGDDWWGYKYGWSPMHPFSMSTWNPNTSRYEYGWEHSAAPPPGGGQAVTMHGDVYLDGHQVGTVVAHGQADQMSLPSAGPTAPDVRIDPPQTGSGWPW